MLYIYIYIYIYIYDDGDDDDDDDIRFICPKIRSCRPFARAGRK